MTNWMGARRLRWFIAWEGGTTQKRLQERARLWSLTLSTYSWFHRGHRKLSEIKRDMMSGSGIKSQHTAWRTPPHPASTSVYTGSKLSAGAKQDIVCNHRCATWYIFKFNVRTSRQHKLYKNEMYHMWGPPFTVNVSLMYEWNEWNASKLFERLLVEILGEALDSDVLQYGFKKNCSTSHALFSFGESVRYFTSQGIVRFTVYHWMPVSRGVYPP